MQLARPLLATDPRRFGKGRRRFFDQAPPARGSVRDDLTLFLTTFAAGFLVVSILIG
jgi:hypothetical protein